MLQHVKETIALKLSKQNHSAAPKIAEYWKRYQYLIHWHWITIITAFSSIGLCLFILYMLVSPLPKLPVPDFASEQPVTTGATQTESVRLLDTYIEPLKTRDLFKPSVPIADQNKIGKTTAEQLAQRLQFLGTSGDEQNLSALVFIPERGPASFHTGDRVAEFVLKSITKDSLVLELENEQITLKR
jgi:hypothetical protein